MTAITRNLPWFIRDPAVSLVGEKCYRSLVEELHFGDLECLKFALSKGLGLGIVVGGSVVKVPQVLLILSARSARGLSLPAYVLETLAYAITLAYSYRNHFPFSTYGENLFLTLQNAVITVLIVAYPSARRTTRRAASPTLTALALLAAGGLLYAAPAGALRVLQAGTLPLSALAKLPQIRANHAARSTGQLSALAVGAQAAGCAARLFTTAAEVGDALLLGAFALALALNCVLAAQMWAYWGRAGAADVLGGGPEKDAAEKAPWVRQAAVDIDPLPAPTPAPAPAPPQGPPQGGRKWARKVD